jgi:hypothetical protein
MKTLMQLVATDFDAEGVTRRMTGRSLEEWDQEWRRRRLNGHLSRRLNGSHLYTATERLEAIQYYDLAEEDFDAVIGSTGLGELKLPFELSKLEVVALSAEDAHRHVTHHETEATQSCPPLRALVLYRLSQAALQRIANEPRPEQARAANY